MLDKPKGPRDVDEIFRGAKAFRNALWNNRKEREIEPDWEIEIDIDF